MRYLIFILWVFTLSCGEEDCSPGAESIVYSIAPGSKLSTPRTVSEYSGPAKGKWRIKLIEGWDCYTLFPYSENHDWMKLRGSTFNFWNNDQDNVLLGVRWIPEQDDNNDVPDPCVGDLQISFYLNVDGVRWDAWFPQDTPEQIELHEDWPVIEVEQGEWIDFEYTTSNGWVHMQITYDGEEYKKSLPHSGISEYRRTINPYGGGTSPVNTYKEVEIICIEF